MAGRKDSVKFKCKETSESKRRNLGLITVKNMASFNYCNLGAICPAVSDSACNVGKLLSATDLCKESATWTGNQSFVYCKVRGCRKLSPIGLHLLLLHKETINCS